MTDCLFSIVDSAEHFFPGHPEVPFRLSKLYDWRDNPPYAGMIYVPAEKAMNKDIARVHNPQMMLSIQVACQMGITEVDDAPTYVCEHSCESAFMAAGTTLKLSRMIVAPKAEVRRGFAIVRPPGHHANAERPSGFCLFNNVAIAVADALASGMQKVAIFDFDAHHGDGTQAIFLNDERVGFFSLHQEGIFPGSGGLDDVCLKAKRVINLPLPLNCGDEILPSVIQEILKPWLDDFHPEMIFVSAGFDGHFLDPLTGLNFSTTGFFALAKALISGAETLSDGRILFVLEGGYDPQILHDNIQAVLCALTDGESYPNSSGASWHKPIEISDRIKLLRQLHKI